MGQLKLKSIKTADPNTLSELESMVHELERVIQRYSHVTEHLPNPFINALDRFKWDVEYVRKHRKNGTSGFAQHNNNP